MLTQCYDLMWNCGDLVEVIVPKQLQCSLFQVNPYLGLLSMDELNYLCHLPNVILPPTTLTRCDPLSYGGLSNFPFSPAATCGNLTEQLSKVKNPPNVTYPAGNGPITYEDVVKLYCSVSGGEDSVRTRTCLYDVAESKYQLIGDSLECGGKCLYPFFIN